MRIIGSKIRIRANRQIRYNISGLLGKRKCFLNKWQFVLFCGKNRVLKRGFIVCKKKRFFKRRNIDRNFFLLKHILKNLCLTSSYNVIVAMHGKPEYVRMKDEIEFASIGQLTFKYWHLTKQWISTIFKYNKVCFSFTKILNGALLILQSDNLLDVFSTYDLFLHKRTSCLGFVLFNRFIWASYFIEMVSNVDKLFESFQEKVNNYNLVLVTLFQNLFFNFFPFLKFFFNCKKVTDKANVIVSDIVSITNKV